MTEAQVALAEMLVNGRGGPSGPCRGAGNCSSAPPAPAMSARCSPLGAMYGGGHDVPWDRPEAQRWFRTAAERGHAHAQMMLGRYLARGLAGETEPGGGAEWLDRPRRRGWKRRRRDLAALPATAGRRRGGWPGRRAPDRRGRAAPRADAAPAERTAGTGRRRGEDARRAAFRTGAGGFHRGQDAARRRRCRRRRCRWIERARRFAPDDDTLRCRPRPWPGSALGDPRPRGPAAGGGGAPVRRARGLVRRSLGACRAGTGRRGGGGAAGAAVAPRAAGRAGFTAIGRRDRPRAGAAGWCGRAADGSIAAAAPRPSSRHAGRAAAWRGAALATPPESRHSGARPSTARALLGSPLDLAAFGRVEGFVACRRRRPERLGLASRRPGRARRC